MGGAPWWLPDNWTIVALGLISGHSMAQAWALHCRYARGRKPRRYIKALMTMAVTIPLLSLFVWLDGSTLRKALGVGLPYGCASPVLWIVIQEAVALRSPALAAKLGYDRRTDRPNDGAWGESKRELYRRGLFEDTASMPAIKNPNGNGKNDDVD